MIFILQPWQLLLVILAAILNRKQQEIIDLQSAQIKTLFAIQGKKRLRLNDDQRRVLAVKAKAVGYKALQGLTTIVTPDTLMRWHRELVAQKWDYSEKQMKKGSGGRESVFEFDSRPLRSPLFPCAGTDQPHRRATNERHPGR